MANKEKSFYQRLTRLFRSGPAVRRKIKGQDYKNYYDNQVVQNNLGYYGAASFKREASPFSVMGAYGILDRVSRYSEFAEMENCLHGDTKIAIPGGYKTLKELTGEYGTEKEFIVYSYDHTKKAIVPAVAKQARHTTTTDSYRVKFDNGKEIIGTADHRLMKRDGSYCEIKDLKTGDAMMPFYRKSYKDENLIYTMGTKKCSSKWSPEELLLTNSVKKENKTKQDIKFGHIIQWCDENIYNLHLISNAFGVNSSIIENKLKTKGFENFNVFKKTYSKKEKRTNFLKICNSFEKGMNQKDVIKKTELSKSEILKEVITNGFKSWQDFSLTYENLKVVSVEYYGITDLYDITVDGYKNFATDSLIAHNTAEIATALNVYADESCASDEKGKTFHIYSENAQIQKALEDLFYEVMNIDFNARRMIRNLVKNGDYFCYVEVAPEFGVVNVEPLPVNEIEREEGFDKNDPYAVRFRLITRGGKYLENWQMLHFRILGNDLFLPYGTSILEAARRPWRQLCVAQGTPVWTKDHGYCNIENVKQGDTVYCFDPETSKLVETKVKHTLSMGVQNLVNVSTKHRSITVTPNHGMLVKDIKGEIYKKKAEELDNTDCLILPVVEDGETTCAETIYMANEPYTYKVIKSVNYEPKGIIAKLTAMGINEANVKNAHWFLRGKRKISYDLLSTLRKEFDIPDSLLQKYWRHSNKKSNFETANFSYTPDEDFMRFLGFMYGDGWVNKNTVGFALGVYEEQNEFYINLAQKLFKNTRVYKCNTGIKGSHGGSVKIDSTEAAELLRAAGFTTGFANKFIPSWVFRCPRKYKQQFIKGLFDADGCNSTGTISFANKRLITDLQQLCQQVGIHTGKIRHGNKEGAYLDKKTGKTGHRHASYVLWINLNHIENPNNLLFEKVLEVTKTDPGMTYDLEVEHSAHNFIADSVSVSNTMMEDAMLVYRLVRSPERRVFYVDVSAVHPNDIPTYMEAVKESMRGASVIDQQQGRQDFRYNPLPVHKDTKIPLLDGRTITIENLSAEFDSGKENWVYSIKDSVSQIVPGKVVWCGKNYTAEKLIKVTLDDGTFLKVAPEHPFILRDGTSIRADQLKTEMSLMPLYREVTKKGYERCYNPATGKYESTHTLVAKDVYKDLWESTKSAVVHHKSPWNGNGNKLNNRPDNLEVMNFWDHRKMHADSIQNTLLRPEVLLENSKRLKEYNKTKRHSLTTIENNKKYNKGERMAKAYNISPLHKEHNQIRKIAQHKSWQLNKSYRSEAMRIKFTQECLKLAIEILKSNPEITRDNFGALLQKDNDFINQYKQANSKTKRANKIPNHRILAQNLSVFAGFPNYSSFKDSILAEETIYRNHKVMAVEELLETVDVYCMTVEGSNGEQDRHNFAAISFDDAENQNSAVFLKNSVEDDYFLPTRPNNQSKIENLPGGQNATATEDVEYIQRKLIAALMVPKAYLTYDEAISCLVGETQIPLLDGTNPTIKELSDKFESGELQETYCYSTLLDGTVVPGKITKAWATKQVDELYRIHLDNGEYVDCTNNHPFLLKEGIYKRADELKVSDSLMPVYKKISEKEKGDRLQGYEMVFNNQTGEWEYTHKVVSNWNAENKGGHTIGKQRVVHHKNFNKIDNHPENLEEMTWYGHRKLHSNNLETTILRPDVMISREPARLAALAAPKHRNLKSLQMKKQMSNAESSLRKWVHGNKIKEVVSDNMKLAWKQEEYRAVKTKQNKEILQRPEVREKIFGKNHWAAKATSHFTLPWLISYCKEKNVTEYLHFRNSAKTGAPCGIAVVDRILKENNIKGWREFKKQHLLFNHKIVRIEILNETVNMPWVYDLEVEHTHNFLVKQGVIVHNSKSVLAQEDIRFSRTIATLQKIMVAELNKLAIIHLYALGFSGEDLLNFELKFSNPSTVAVQQKLALISTKIEIAGKAWEMSKETGMLSIPYIQREILGLRPEETNQITLESRQDQVAIALLKKIAENPPFDDSIESNIDIFDKGNYKVPTSPFAPDKKDLRDIENQNLESERELRAQRQKERKEKEGDNATLPIKFNSTPNLDKAFRKRDRNVEFTGDRALINPNFKAMLDPVSNRYAKDPFDTESMKSLHKFVIKEEQMQKELLGNKVLPLKLSKEMQSSLIRMNESIKPTIEIKGIEVVNENDKEIIDELFLIEKDLETEE